MTYDFDYYTGNDLIWPKRPIKPTLIGRNPSPTELRVYADDLEVYQAEMVGYNEDLSFYKQTLNIRRLELQTKLRNDYDITESQMFILWNKAYEDGHSEGLNRVVALFDEYYDLASEFAALEK
jgi:hypothetical protein